jgi:hypothetical protein
MAFGLSIRGTCAGRSTQHQTRALTVPEPNVALLFEWVSRLPTALAANCGKRRIRYVAVFWAALTLAKSLIYAPSITVTEQNFSLKTAVAN